VKCIETADVIKCHVTPTLTLMHLLSCSGLFCWSVLCSYAVCLL